MNYSGKYMKMNYEKSKTFGKMIKSIYLEMCSLKLKL